MRLVTDIKAVAAALVGRLRFPSGGGWSLFSGRSKLNYSSVVGDGSGSSAIMACVRALSRAYTEAPIEVLERTRRGWDPLDDHPLVELLDRPNPYMSGPLLTRAVVASLNLDGNAYLYKVRSAARRVVELWPIFPHLIEPVAPDDGSAFLSHYAYQPGQGQPIRIDPADVVHHRLDLDPRNTRKGLSPLKSLLREVFTDLEAGDFAAQILANLGIPGVIISPDTDAGIQQGDVERMKTYFEGRFGGDNRGRPMVLGGKTKVSVLSFSPEQLNLRDIRTISEERIAAVLGVPAIIAGLGAGLQRSTYSNYAEARESFYETGIIPLQQLIAADYRTQLLVEFEGDIKGKRVAYNLSGIRVLQEDETRRQERIRAAFTGGIIKLNEARTALGFENEPSGDVYVRPISVTEIRPDQLGQVPRPPALPPGRPDDDDDPPKPDEKLLDYETKGADESALFAAALRTLRERLEPGFAQAITASFAAQADRVAARLVASDTTKAAPDDPNLFSGEDQKLATEWRGHYVTLLQNSWPVINDRIGLEMSFDLADPAVVRTLDEAGTRIKGINDTTRDAVRAALRAGADAGEGIDPSDDAPGLAARVRAVIQETYKGRAVTIARTELGTAQQTAAVGRYEASAVVSKVKVLDGTGDDICKAVAGTTQTLAWAKVNLLGHPRCIRAFAPIVDDVS